MKRIDSGNARPDENGLGKAGFNDNADLPQQDATYLSPSWLNMMQEELCNLLELRGISLNPESKRQLYDLLSTQTDLEALATEIENNFIRKMQIIDNLTTNDATKPVSAKQAKKLQDEKLDKSALNNTLTSTSTTQAVTAAQAKVLNDQAFGVNQTYIDVTASRVSGTTYTNTTSKTITVYVEILSSSGPELNTIEVSGNVLSSGDWGIDSMRTALSFPVPIGATYKITTSNQHSIIKKWSELR